MKIAHVAGRWCDFLLVSGLVAGLVSGLVACSQSAGDVRTLVIGKVGDLATLDPAAATNNNDYTAISLAYQQLLAFEVEGGKPTGTLVGELAESWSSDDDGLIWTFTLKRGQYFDDGTEVTAAAVDFTFDRIIRVGRSAAQSVEAWLKEIEVIDDYSLRIHLNDVFPAFLPLLALSGGSIVNPAVMAHELDADNAMGWLSEHTAGSGSYRLASWERGERASMEVNPYAAHQPRFFNRVLLKVIADQSARRIQLEKGDLDIMEGMVQRWVETMQSAPGVRVFSAPSYELYHLWLNTRQPPLDNVKLRQALRKAVDYEGIIANLLGGQAQAMRGTLLPGIPGYDADLPLNSMDVEGAKQLLAEVGFGDGVSLSMLTGAPDPGSLAQALQGNFAEVGVDVELLPHHAAAYQSKLSSGDFHMALSGWYIDFPDPWAIMNYMFVKRTIGEGGNYSFYANDAVDDLLNRAATSAATSDRTALYQQAQRIIDEDSPVIFLYVVNGMLALRDDIKGLNYNMSQQLMYNVADMYREQ